MVKTTEAAALLTVAASFDNRKADADQAKAWALALDGLRFTDCRDAIVQHYQRSREWLMPFEVISGVKRIRAKRIAEHPPVDPPSGLDPDNARALIRWQRETDEAIADGTYMAPDVQALPQRDVIGELGQVGQSVEDLRANARKAREKRDAERSEEKRAKDERRANVERMRAADRAAREAKPEDDA